mmetsp:Transcript_591/g.1116  ORF Transcript_591/g.1116 Transcript_591/m.1116 type:complete len:230 (-) Transcript_591:325-1014(-)
MSGEVVRNQSFHVNIKVSIKSKRLTLKPVRFPTYPLETPKMTSAYTKVNQLEEGLPLKLNEDDAQLSLRQRQAAEVGVEFSSQASDKVTEGSTSGKLALKKEPLETERSPPPGASPGGVWGTSTHFGDETKFSSFLCCLFCGGLIPVCIHCCLPFDRQRVYKVQGKVYDTGGNYLGLADGGVEFVEGKLGHNIDSQKRDKVYTICAVVIVLLIVLKLMGSSSQPYSYNY